MIFGFLIFLIAITRKVMKLQTLDGFLLISSIRAVCLWGGRSMEGQIVSTEKQNTKIERAAENIEKAKQTIEKWTS